ncbi:hypothetical protein K493DRAFT_209591, partial [Basidiobolus meristosporus CBS 931.73]
IQGLSRGEQLRNVANQITHSSFYTILYMLMAALSFVSVTLLANPLLSPGTFFVLLEVIINATLITEVGIRILSMGQAFWRWWLNIFDIIIVLLCILTLGYLRYGCTPNAEREELAGTILLAIRNSIQFFRLYTTLRE